MKILVRQLNTRYLVHGIKPVGNGFMNTYMSVREGEYFKKNHRESRHKTSPSNNDVFVVLEKHNRQMKRPVVFIQDYEEMNGPLGLSSTI